MGKTVGKYIAILQHDPLTFEASRGERVGRHACNAAPVVGKPSACCLSKHLTERAEFLYVPQIQENGPEYVHAAARGR